MAQVLFFNIYLFIYLLESQVYREEERQIGRSSVQWFTPQVSATSNAMPKPGSRNLFPGIPHGIRVPRFWAILDCFRMPQAGSWTGSTAAGIRTGALWDLGVPKARTLATRPHCQTKDGPSFWYPTTTQETQGSAGFSSLQFCSLWPLLLSLKLPAQIKIKQTIF